MGDLKYKVGDRVRIKSLDWYNRHTNGTEIDCGRVPFTSGMKWFCSCVMTISFVHADCYTMVEDLENYYTDEMIESLVERNGKTYPYKIGDRVVLKGSNRCATITDLKYNSWGNLSYYIKIDNDKDISIDYPTDLLLPYDNKIEGLVEEETKPKNEDEKNGESKPKYEDEVNGEYYSTPKYLVRPSGYQFVDENGNVINARKIALEKKKKEYPKTYEECSLITGYEDRIPLKIIGEFTRLINARNAYWKLYGEEMGLGKSWEPDYSGTFEDGTPIKYVIYNIGTHIVKERKSSPKHILSFPTAEMRDEFYENFKKEIEICKEFL